MGQQHIRASSDPFTVGMPMERAVATISDARVWYPGFCPGNPAGTMVSEGQQTRRDVPGAGATFQFVRMDILDRTSRVRQRRIVVHQQGHAYHAQANTNVTIKLFTAEGRRLVFNVDETWRQFVLDFEFAATSQNKTSITITTESHYLDCLCGGSNRWQRQRLEKELNAAANKIQHKL